jgi:hypothetical protein
MHSAGLERLRSKTIKVHKRVSYYENQTSLSVMKVDIRNEIDMCVCLGMVPFRFRTLDAAKPLLRECSRCKISQSRLHFSKYATRNHRRREKRIFMNTYGGHATLKSSILMNQSRGRIQFSYKGQELIGKI